MITWRVLYKSLSTNQQRPIGFIGGSSKERKQHPIWKDAILIEESGNKSAQCLELHAVFLAVIEEMKHGKIPMFGFYSLMGSGQ